MFFYFKMSDWNITYHKKLKINNAVLIEGMPGIGNVGKIAADIIVEQLKAKKIVSLFSECLPNSVFVTEDNLVELPKIEVFHAKKNSKDFLFLVGDVQPMKERDSFSFAQAVIKIASDLKCKEIVALGGIGLNEAPEKPKVYCTGNDNKFIQEFVKYKVNNKLYGVVGPIMGISGLLLGLSNPKKIKAVALLAETSAHPMHIGLRGAKELIIIIQKKYKLGVDVKKIEIDIKSFEEEIDPKDRKDLIEKENIKFKVSRDASYIG